MASSSPIKYDSVPLQFNMASLGLTRLPCSECSMFQDFLTSNFSFGIWQPRWGQAAGLGKLTERPENSGVRSPVYVLPTCSTLAPTQVASSCFSRHWLQSTPAPLVMEPVPQTWAAASLHGSGPACPISSLVTRCPSLLVVDPGGMP